MLTHLKELLMQPPMVVMLTQLTIFLAAASVSVVIAGFVMRQQAIRRRFFAEGSGSIGGATPGDEQAEKALRLIATIGKSFTPRSEETAALVRRQLIQAGCHGRAAPVIYWLARIASALLLPLIVGAVLETLLPAMGTGSLIFLLTTLAGAGLFLPAVWLSRQMRHAQEEHVIGFPDLMDLLVVATDAGASIEAALERVGREIIASYPVLGANVHIMTLELRAGRSLSDALVNFAERAGIEEARSFAALIQQSEQLGASINNALRVYSAEMRTKRLQRAEEKAHALPVKLVIPLGLFVFPVMLIVTMLPVLIRLKNAIHATQ